MRCCLSPSEAEKQQARKNREIKNKIEADKPKTCTVLLLGTGDAGKSTIVRQLRVIHEEGIPLQDRLKFTNILRDNCLGGMQKILSAGSERHIEIPEQYWKSTQIIENATKLTPDIAEHIVELWDTSFVREILEFHKSLQLPGGYSGVKYYVTQAKRFSSEDYEPTHEDVVRAKLRTTGITEVTLKMGSRDFRIVDVGGQRSERRKWLHHFESINAVIYVVALNEYDMVLEEDGETNRLEESLKLFQVLTRARWLKDKPWILFLNKVDLFQQEIEEKPIEHIFPEYCNWVKELKNGDQMDKMQLGIEYIKYQFHKSFYGATLYSYPTCAIDQHQCDTVFKVVRREIIEEALVLSGI